MAVRGRHPALDGFGHIFDVEARLSPREQARERLLILQANRSERVADFYDWALRVPEPKTGKLDFNRFAFQKELYQDTVYDPEVVVVKSVQVGISAFLVRWATFLADTRGQTALYVMPKKGQALDFSDSRLKRIILGSEYLSERVSRETVANKNVKAIGLGLIYMRGSESVDDLQSIDADCLALDEYDDLFEPHIPDAERRLSGSLEPRIRRVGVPSVPEWGIDQLFLESDRRHWRVKCEGCGLWQQLDFWKNVDTEKALVVCEKCSKPLKVETGEWVADYPDRRVPGYHISRLIVPGKVGIETIIRNSKKTRPYESQAFMNKDLGLPFAHAEGRLSPEAIAAAQRDDIEMVEGYQGGAIVTMGVDVASTRPLSVRISEHLPDGRKKALWIGEVRDFNALEPLMDRYSVSMACIDHLPEGRLARSFAARFPGRVYLVAYSQTQGEVLKVKEAENLVTVRRIEAIDAVMEMVRSQRNLLPRVLPEGYVDEMRALVRVTREDEVGRMTVQYRSGRPDDFAHAEAYDLVAWEAWRIRQAVGHEVIQPLDEMLEFERADFNDYDDGEDETYSPGFDL